MTAWRGPDVLVAGAGPAGAVAAIALARQGIRVLLAGELPTPSAPSHDVWMTAPAIRILRDLGVAGDVTLRRMDAIAPWFGRSPGREITDAGAAVCDLTTLRHALAGAAVAAGAEHITGNVASVSRSRDQFRAVVGDTIVAARHVVIATGAAVPVLPDVAAAGPAIDAGGVPRASAPPAAAGFACARRFSGLRLGGRMMLVMTAPRTTDPHEHPTCVWALPSTGGVATVGVATMNQPGLAENGPDAVSPAALIDMAVEILAGCGAGDTALRPVGPLSSGALHSGLTTQLGAAAGNLLIGDAAGLASPFTGEGITFAARSGVLAAEAIGTHVLDPDAALRAYAREARRTFADYFEATRQAAHRYRLTWQMLADSADTDLPLFAKARRVILLPPSLTGVTGTDQVRADYRTRADTGPFLTACDEVAASVVRGNWLFLARLVMCGEPADSYRLRPALLFLAGLMAEGKPPAIARATPAAAIELAMLATLAHVGVPTAPSPRRGVNWVTSTAVLGGDFLLAEAYRLVTESAPEMSWPFADWLTELTALRAKSLDSDDPAIAADIFAALFEFPVRMGALAAGCSQRTAETLREFGEHCGRAFLHVEDFLAVRGGQTRLNTTRAAMVKARVTALPDGADATTAASAAIRATERAVRAASGVPGLAAARLLVEFARTVASPARP